MKVNFWHILIVLLLGVCIIILLNGCSPPAETTLPEVRYVGFKVYDPVYVAVDKGFFEKHGIKVNLISTVLGGPTAIQAVSAGSAEGGLSSVPALVNANAAGLPVQGVVDIQTSMEGQALQRWFVRSDSDIHSFEDLAGKTYAVNLWKSSFHYTSLMALDQRAIDPESINWVLLAFDKQIPALANGEVDVIGLMEPYQSFARKEYGNEFRELFNDYDNVFYSSRHVSLIFINRIWAKDHPAEAQAFVSGIVDAINWIEQNEEEAKAIISKYTEIPIDSVPVYHFTPNGEVRSDDVQWWMDFLKKRGDLTVDWLLPEDVATNKYPK